MNTTRSLLQKIMNATSASSLITSSSRSALVKSRCAISPFGGRVARLVTNAEKEKSKAESEKEAGFERRCSPPGLRFRRRGHWGGMMRGSPLGPSLLFDPRSVVDELFDEPFMALDNIWEDQPSSLLQHVVGTPRVDVAEFPKEYKVTIDLPGMKSDDVNIDVDDDQNGNPYLTISAQHEEKTIKKGSEDEPTKWFMRERIKTQFSRTFSLPPEKANIDEIKASMKEGVLVVSIQKKPEALEEKKKPPHRKIPIS